MTQNALDQLLGRARGPLEPNGRLTPSQFFPPGGTYDFDTMAVHDAADALQIRGPIAQKIHAVPDGATIRLGAE
ncbi:hypothetical protein [Kitasatospora terrestris]|uniref:Uncharacterized protein n=1 Tax=Kitasatospora terrestris TaxID=258051 RepID=A0ABP9EFR5_9ACTN